MAYSGFSLTFLGGEGWLENNSLYLTLVYGSVLFIFNQGLEGVALQTMHSQETVKNVLSVPAKNLSLQYF